MQCDIRSGTGDANRPLQIHDRIAQIGLYLAGRIATGRPLDGGGVDQSERAIGADVVRIDRQGRFGSGFGLRPLVVAQVEACHLGMNLRRSGVGRGRSLQGRERTRVVALRFEAARHEKCEIGL